MILRHITPGLFWLSFLYTFNNNALLGTILLFPSCLFISFLFNHMFLFFQSCLFNHVSIIFFQSLLFNMFLSMFSVSYIIYFEAIQSSRSDCLFPLVSYQ